VTPPLSWPDQACTTKKTIVPNENLGFDLVVEGQTSSYFAVIYPIPLLYAGPAWSLVTFTPLPRLRSTSRFGTAWERANAEILRTTFSLDSLASAWVEFIRTHTKYSQTQQYRTKEASASYILTCAAQPPFLPLDREEE
jgi:hypothetical protein